MLENLIASEYLYENEEFKIKIKNLTENEKLEWYKRMEEMKEANDGELNNEELLYDMYRELIICEGKMNFKEMSFENFLIFINSDFLTEVAEDINRCMTTLYTSIMKTGLLNQKSKLEELEMNMALLLVQQKLNDYLSLVQEQTKQERWVKSELKRIRNIKPHPELDELNRVSRWAIFKAKWKLNREIRRKEKLQQKEDQ
ncbi:hypothetical protein AM596_15520 [Clostridium perfringens CP4]|uniref:hypothetical protein n=1 Tax=Clostridium perfringens TaxID=1502 RepID=UPI0007077260|nr:hypothetical protein [Clostridium perfringens]KQC91264.1 hypothetical protein AM596_15735 [Clostridium perfringens CP4]KQC91280.1 hypothetical protein AM596_15520 [Clostridium perfringens CP4]